MAHRAATSATKSRSASVLWILQKGLLISSDDDLEILFCVGSVDQILPKLFCHLMVLEHLQPLDGIVQLDSLGSFADPLEKELRRTLADMTCRRADFHVIRCGGSKTECF